MFIYLFILVFLFAFRNTKKTIPQLLCFVLLFALAAFRDFSVGTDTGQYYNRYFYVHENTDVLDNIFTGKFEYFESYLYIYGHRLHLTFRNILEIGSAVFVSLFFFFFRQRLDKPIMGVLIFFALWFYLPFFNIFRNILAMTVLMFGYLYLENRGIRFFHDGREHSSKIRDILSVPIFVLIVLVGGAIHQSVLVLLLMLPFKYIRANFKIVLALLFITLILGMFIDTTAQLRLLLVFFSDATRFDNYVQNIGAHFVITPFIEIFFLVIIYFSYNKKIDFENNIYFKAWIMSLLFLHIFGFASTYGSRVVLSFSVAKCVLLADCLNYKNKQGSIIIYVYLLYTFAKSLLMGYDGVVPYKLMSL